MTYTTRMHLTMITETEINVLKVMAEKDIKLELDESRSHTIHKANSRIR